MHTKISTRLFKKLLLVAVGDLAFFSVISPNRTSTPLPVLMIACVLVGATVYSACRVGISLFSAAFQLQLSTQKRAALSVTIALTFLVLMGSIGQLDWHDILAVVPLALVSYFYLSYMSKPSDQDNRTRA